MNNPEQEKYFEELKALKELQNSTEKQIINNPSFILNKQRLTLDFLSAGDVKHLKKVFKLVNNLLQSDNEEVVENFSLFKQSIKEEILKINSKVNITVKEFDIKYNMSKSSQQHYRSRLEDPLPYHQKKFRGKIVYVVEEVEQWFANQYK